MANTQKKKKNALAKREKASNPQTNTVTATMRGVTSHRAAGSWGRGSGQARHGVGDGVAGYLLVGDESSGN